MVVLAMAVLVLAIGWMVPRKMIAVGVEELSARERAAAERALASYTGFCYDNPLSRVFIRKVRIAEVRYEPRRCTDTRFPGISPSDGYYVRLRVHGLFGIPTKTMVACGAVFLCDARENEFLPPALLRLGAVNGQSGRSSCAIAETKRGYSRSSRPVSADDARQAALLRAASQVMPRLPRREPRENSILHSAGQAVTPPVAL